MAKRQTIWLSTMMVLSLMLIGFYTVNNNTQTVSTTDTNNQVTSSQKATDNSKDQAAMTQGSDYFVAAHLDEGKQVGAKIEQLQQIIADSKSTPGQIDKAKKELDALNADQAKIDNLHDQLQSMNYPDALINVNGNQVNVTVEAQHLEKKSAVHIMDIVQKQFPDTQVTVSTHA